MTGIQLQFYSNHNGNLFGEITDDHIRAIVERAKRLGLIAPYSGVNTVPTTEQSSVVQPAAPADDEATIDAMVMALARDKRDSTHSGIAKVLLAAIRRGEVPGLTTTDAEEKLAQKLLKRIAENTELLFENQSIKAEVERLRAELATQKTDNGGLLSDLMAARGERYAAIARAEESEKYRVLNGQLCDQACTQRDTARAAHAEAMLKLNDVTKWAEGLIRQLPAGHNGRDSWLLNYGTGYDVEEMRDKHPTYRAKHRNKDASK